MLLCRNPWLQHLCQRGSSRTEFHRAGKFFVETGQAQPIHASPKVVTCLEWIFNGGSNVTAVAILLENDVQRESQAWGLASTEANGDGLVAPIKVLAVEL